MAIQRGQSHLPQSNARSAEPNTAHLVIQEVGYAIEMKIGAGRIAFPVAGMSLALRDAAHARIGKPSVKQ